jgi:hypothetical protein
MGSNKNILEVGHSRSYPSRIESLRESFFSEKRFRPSRQACGNAKIHEINTSGNRESWSPGQRAAVELFSVPAAELEPIAPY